MLSVPSHRVNRNNSAKNSKRSNDSKKSTSVPPRSQTRMDESTMRSVNRAAQQEFMLIDPSLKFENSRAATRLNVEHTGIRIPNANL